MTTSSNSAPLPRWGRWLAVLGLIGLGIVIVVLLRAGRAPVVPTAAATRGHAPNEGGKTGSDHVHEAGHDEHAHDGHGHEGEDHDEHGHGEEGVATFTPAALAKAGIEVQAVSTGALSSQLQVTGVVEPDLAGVVKVTPRVEGKLTELRANVGDRVAAGQVIARMSSIQLAAAQGQYRHAVARASAARANLKRQRQLAGFGEFGQHKLHEARGIYNAAREDVNEALAEVNAARNEVAQSEAALAAARGDEVGARGDVTVAETGVVQAESQAEVTRSRFQRQEALLKEELTSRQEWEQAGADYLKAQADVRAARARADAARARVETAVAKTSQARSVIETQRAHVIRAQAKRLAAHERFTLAAEAMQREEKIYKSGVFASKEVADAESALGQAEIDRNAAADAVRLLGGVPAGGNILAIASPLAGRVTERTVTAGEMVSPEKALVTIVNLDSVWVQLNVYPRDLPAVRVGSPVAITSDAAPERSIRGRVAYVGDALDETTRTIRVRCVIPNTEGRLKPEMFVRGRIDVGGRGTGVSVPRDAVQSLEGRNVVFVPGEKPGEFRAREVQTGETVDGKTIISQGLAAGERVVTRGAFLVKAQSMKGELGHSHAH